MRLRLACLLSATLMFGCGNDSEPAIPDGKNTLIRVDAPGPEMNEARMGILISCNDTVVVPAQPSGDFFDFETELELMSSNGSMSLWEGAFNLPVGECVFTLGFHCAGELVCMGSQTMTIEDGDNIYDVVLVCSLPIGSRFDACFNEPSGALLGECRGRPLDACDVDGKCKLGYAFALDPETLCIDPTGVSKPVSCGGNGGDVDGAITTVIDPDGGLWSVHVSVLPDGWSYPAEPIDLNACDDGVPREE